jgi:hypothetical protein
VKKRHTFELIVIFGHFVRVTHKVEKVPSAKSRQAGVSFRKQAQTNFGKLIVDVEGVLLCAHLVSRPRASGRSLGDRKGNGSPATVCCNISECLG